MHFDPDAHRYWYGGRWLPYSISAIASPLPPEEKARIMASQHVWGPRGTQVHLAMEQHFSGRALTHDRAYSAWVDAALRHWFIQQVRQPLALEYSVVLPEVGGGIAGSFDALLRMDDGTVCLCDYKTVGSLASVPTRKPADAQLGGYLQGLAAAHPDLAVHRCVTLVLGPGLCVPRFSEPADCLQAWDQAVCQHDAAVAALGF